MIMKCADCDKCILDMETGCPVCTQKAERTDYENECDCENKG